MLLNRTFHLFWLVVSAIILLVSCSAEQGELQFYANGESFVRDGFVAKDGWEITFDHVYMTLSNVTAYQSDPPFDAASAAAPTGTQAQLGDPVAIDLRDSAADGRVLVGTVAADIGQYNAISWSMDAGENGSVQLLGSAEKAGETIQFDLQIGRAYQYACGEYVGDARNGFVRTDETGDIEMTFHLDHIFGDADTPADDTLNVGALGFQPLAELAENGTLQGTIDTLGLSTADLDLLQEAYGTLGHVGEGHCYEAIAGYTGD